MHWAADKMQKWARASRYRWGFLLLFCFLWWTCSKVTESLSHGSDWTSRIRIRNLVPSTLIPDLVFLSETGENYVLSLPALLLCWCFFNKDCKIFGFFQTHFNLFISYVRTRHSNRRLAAATISCTTHANLILKYFIACCQAETCHIQPV